MRGRIHSMETMGTLDGPGLRCVVFLQGCPLRCQYCHNPDTWDATQGEEIDSAQLVERVARYRPYFGSNGGVTLSGGEPFLQASFVGEVLRGCHALGIHTAVDTSGFLLNDAVRAALSDTDLVILDIKHTDPARYRELTGQALEPTLAFLQYVATQGIPLWVRQVVLPGWTDTPAAMHALADLLRDIPSLQRVELLPYHAMGAAKWAALGRPYPLTGIAEPDAELLATLRQVLQAAHLPTSPPTDTSGPRSR